MKYETRGMKSKSIAVYSVMLSFAVLVLAVAVPSVYAQNGGNVSGGSSNKQAKDSLRVSPVRTDVVIKPGESRTVKVSVQNMTDSTLTFKPINNDFVAGDSEDGSPSIIFDENEYAPTHSLKRFMKPIPNVVVGPSEQVGVDVVINVPHNAQAGGYYGAVRFAPVLPDGSSSVNVSGSVASLILMKVPGNVVENLTMKEFAVTQKGKASTRFSSPKDIDVTVRLENKGNVHIAPFGNIFVTKGKDMVYSAKINDKKPAGVILPDSTRKWTVPAEKIGNFGKYNITAVVGYGENNKTINIEKSIWIIPTIYIVGAIVAVLVLIGIIVAIFMSLRAYKRRILRSSRRR